MVTNADYQATYTTPEHGVVRYPSSAKESVNGWAYVFTKDESYPADLQSKGHMVQVRFDNQWIAYDGWLPSEEEAFGETDHPPFAEPDETPDPNY